MHTQGPWELDVVGREGNPNDPRHCQVVALTHGKHVVIVDTLNCSCIFSIEDQEANARLIAAAPDLLGLLKELIDIEGLQPGTAGWAGKVRTAIAKAAS